MLTRYEKYRLALDVFAYVNDNQMCSRAELNSWFKASSDVTRGRQLSEALNSLLVTERVRKYLDKESGSVFFWTADFRNSPYAFDTIIPTGDPVVDVYDPAPPQDEIKEDTTSPETDCAPQPVVTLSAAERHWLDMRNGVNGVLRKLYDVLLTNPTKVFPANAPELEAVVPHHVERARFLGRLWSMNVGVRRGSDGPAKFFTLGGTFTLPIEEDVIDKTKAAKKRDEKLAAKEKRDAGMDALRQSIVAQADKAVGNTGVQDEDADDDSDEEDQELEGDGLPHVESTEEESADDTPQMYVSNSYDFLLIRSDGSQVQFDPEESAALRQLILNMNIEKMEKFEDGNN